MGNRLSHSQVSKFQQCGKAYEFWYVKKIRPTKMRSALMFGSALDKAIGVLLKPDEDKTKTPEQIFSYFWRFQDVNGENTYLPDNPNLVYAKSDFDKDLLTSEDIKKLGVSKETIIELAEKRNAQGFDNLSQDEKTLCNEAFWMCLHNKGLYMIDAFRKKVMPRLRKIHSTQEFIELDNGEDKVIGYIDIVAEVEGHNEPIVLDLKTSAVHYEEDSVVTSPQLSLYVHAVSEKYQTKKAGYIVLNKNVIKNRIKICKKCNHDGSGGRHKTCNNDIDGVRCNGDWNETVSPEVYVQFLIDAIPEATENLVLDNIDDINTSIKTGHFTRNLNACTNTYGGVCDYINLCYRNSMKGLINKE
jgi:hypothetical protein